MKLILGTVQLGLDYGITNNNGKPKLEESFEIIKYALDNNINIFDTARAYGESEYILGLAKQKFSGMNIITKLDPLSTLEINTNEKNIYDMIDNSIDISLKNLNIDFIETLLVHRFYSEND